MFDMIKSIFNPNDGGGDGENLLGLGALGGPAGLGLAALTGGLEYYGQQETNAQNRDLAREQMKFQERMSNTAIRRAKTDLEMAGFNPLLAAGNPASSPGGATATMSNPLAGVSATARENLGLMLQAKKQAGEINLMQAQTKATEADERMKNAQALKANVDTAVAKKGIPEAELKNDIYDLVRPVVKKTKEIFLQAAPRPKEQPLQPKFPKGGLLR